ncbi:MAG: polymer-forming cytoskeletal protein [candidate division KSB1 bacterium]|nr:polymer-forming cytoskeletal protein [candidate division KSB1 bacterium]MDZ7273925.1 polymer-forming cytoskeletal protein [candidate division KSB1 bacterium]MDZ7286081.1 polymer-forming cytoskeletal protein [candidate division KSB1 bacterium]MDZ7299113.1 polymer-forming cytoskeletal protein [candidate division KSB1 bacterium]MDZ7306660.1 polymer-forming cytoskeletal protein [candidate division KSB1 bacterium]
MLTRKDNAEAERSSGELNTIIGRGSVFEGTLTVQSSLRVDGKVVGNVQVSDALIVGKEGEIEGEVRVRNAIIGGRVRNRILASGKVVLEAKSVVHGEVKTSRLVIDEGAIFEGRCTMSDDDKAASLPENASRGNRPGTMNMEVMSRHEAAAAR